MTPSNDGTPANTPSATTPETPAPGSTPAAGAAAPAAGAPAAPAPGAAPGSKAGQSVVEAAAAGAPAATPAEPPAGPPAEYALTVSEAGKPYVDDYTLAMIKENARAAGWSNDDAQNAVNEHVTMLARADAHFLAELKADTTYGGDKLTATQEAVKSAIDLVRPEGHPRRAAFLSMVNRVAGGNNIEFVSFLADYGKRIAEDNVGASTSGGNRAERSAAEVLYGNTPTK
jgi:hypothetical protein